MKEGTKPELKSAFDNYMQCILPLPEADIKEGCFLHFADTQLQGNCIDVLMNSAVLV